MKAFLYLSILLLGSFIFHGCADVCAGIECLNEGVCDNGECNCPENYTSKFCNEEKIPNRVYISSIELLGFSEVDGSGNSWDTDGLPDIYLEIDGYGDNDLSTGVINNLSGPHEFPVNMTFDRPWEIISIGVRDHDSGADPYINILFFSPYQEGESFPIEFVVSETVLSSPVQIKVKGIEYQF